VGAGIFLSKIAGFVRERALAYYLGNSKAMDAYRAAFRIPNLLQNLLGEGVLSASFIPVYARLVAQGRMEDASRVARAVGTLLALVASAIALIGVVAARPLAWAIAAGFPDESRELTITLVRIMFPGIALLVLSAWCLGVLNSHRKFFLSYSAPVLWNAALITTTIVAGRRFVGGHRDDDIAVWLAWGMVIGSAAQLLVQLPTVVALLGGLRPSLAVRDPNVRTTLRTFVPILLGRGSVQLSGYLDTFLASFIGEGIVAAMGYAQIVYMLPVSLFGMAVSAAELPEMSSASQDDVAAHVQTRLRSALRRIVFLVVPSAVAFVAIGGSIIALLFQNGRFGASDTDVVWIILAGSAIGLSAGTQGRVLGSAFYALRDPKPPLYAALIRVTLTGVAGWAFALPIRNWLGYSPAWGAFGLTASAGVAAWLEFLLLERWLSARIGKVAIPVKLGLGALAVATLAGALAFGVHHLVDSLGARPWQSALFAIPSFGVVYIALMLAAKVPEAFAVIRRLK
jgi:putative peptidoglycan lipid II flippase